MKQGVIRHWLDRTRPATWQMVLMAIIIAGCFFMWNVRGGPQRAANTRTYLEHIREGQLLAGNHLCPGANEGIGALGAAAAEVLRAEAIEKGVDLERAPGTLRGSREFRTFRWSRGDGSEVILYLPSEGALLCPDEASGWLGNPRK